MVRISAATADLGAETLASQGGTSGLNIREFLPGRCSTWWSDREGSTLASVRHLEVAAGRGVAAGDPVAEPRGFRLCRIHNRRKTCWQLLAAEREVALVQPVISETVVDPKEELVPMVALAGARRLVGSLEQVVGAEAGVRVPAGRSCVVVLEWDARVLVAAAVSTVEGEDTATVEIARVIRAAEALVTSIRCTAKRLKVMIRAFSDGFTRTAARIRTGQMTRGTGKTVPGGLDGSCSWWMVRNTNLTTRALFRLSLCLAQLIRTVMV